MLSRVRSLWRNLVHRRRVERELDDEIRGAFEMLVDEGLETGLDRDAARRAATVRLGQIESPSRPVSATRGPARSGKRASWTSVMASGFSSALRSSPSLPSRRLRSASAPPAPSSRCSTASSCGSSTCPNPIAWSSRRSASPAAVTTTRCPTRISRRIRAAQHDPRCRLFATIRSAEWPSRWQASRGRCRGHVRVSGDYYRTLRLTPAAGRLIAPSGRSAGRSGRRAEPRLLAAPLRRPCRCGRRAVALNQRPVHDCRRRTGRVLRHRSRAALRHQRARCARATRWTKAGRRCGTRRLPRGFT